MIISDFEKELQLINKDLSIRPNNPNPKVLEMFPDTAKLASILYCGSELATIPNYEIFDERNGNYGVDLRQDGRFIPHRTRPEVLSIIKEKLFQIENDKDYADSFFGRGEYSEAELKKSLPTVEVVEEVSQDVQEIQGGMIEGVK